MPFFLEPDRPWGKTIEIEASHRMTSPKTAQRSIIHAPRYFGGLFLQLVEICL